MVAACSGVYPGVPLGVELEVALLVDVVSVLGTLPVVTVLPAAVGADINTLVSRVGPTTVQVHMQSIWSMCHVNITIRKHALISCYFTLTIDPTYVS